MTTNKKIIREFERLIEQIKFDIDFTTGTEQLVNTFRLSAIQNSLKVIKSFPDKITSSKQLKGLKNIGKGTLERIDEILKTGRLSEIKIDANAKGYLKMVFELEKVFGIGRKKAYELVKKYGITSIPDLKKKYQSGKVKLNDVVVKGLKYVDKIKEKIPRKEVDVISGILVDTIVKIDPHLFGMVCGSYRRQLPTSNDVDFIMIHSKIKTKQQLTNGRKYISSLVKELKKKNIIVDSLTDDSVVSKYMGIYHIGNKVLRRLDIRLVPWNSFYPAILYFTGPGEFNRNMRLHAINKGYMLNEYGLYDSKGKEIKVNSEREIFEKLELEYLEPKDRKD